MTNPLFDTLLAPRFKDESSLFQFPDGTNWSYAHTLEISAQFAHSLQQLGVKPSDRVIVQTHKSAEAVALYFACLQMGAIFIPLNTAYTLTELDHFIKDSSPAVVVCDEQAKSALTPLAHQYQTTLTTLNAHGTGELIDQAKNHAKSFQTVSRKDNDLASILYTSGTTGKPKGAMLSHSNLLSNALCLSKTWQFSQKDVLLHALPIFHVHGLFVAINTTLVAGSSLIFLPCFNIEQILTHLPHSTVMMGVPTFYTRLLQQNSLNHELVQNMRLFVSGSAPLSAETHVAFEQKTGHRILERYGMTETGMNTSNPYHGKRIAGSVGLPLDGVEVRVVSQETGQEVKAGEVGMLEVRGENVFQGYWNLPEQTQKEFQSDRFFITGDLGIINQEGYVSIVGRYKDLIISGGYNVYAKEVEETINNLDAVNESAVFGVPHTDFGEGVVALVVCHQGQQISEEDILLSLKETLARFKQPKRIFFAENLPRNVMGKVQKNILREQYKDLF